MFFGKLFRKIFWVFFIVSVPAMGGELLTLEQAVSYALGENPKLKSEEAKVEAAKARIGVATSLEDPMVGVEFYDVPISTTDIKQGMETNYSFIQKFPFPSKLVTARKMAKKGYLSEKSRLDWERINLIVATEHAFHDLYFIDRSLKINRELKNIFSQLSASEAAVYATQKKSSQDFLKAKLEVDKLETENNLLQAERVRIEAALNVLMRRNPSEPIQLAELPKIDHRVFSHQNLEEKILKKHPELKAKELEWEEQKTNVTMARQQAALPDFQTRFTYAERYGQQDAWTGEAMINIPFLWGKNRKGIQEAQAKEKSLRYELENLKNEKLASLKETVAFFEAAQKTHQLYQSRVLPHARVALKSAEAAYASRGITFLDFVDTVRLFKEARLKSLEALVDYHKAATHLKLALGEENL